MPLSHSEAVLSLRDDPLLMTATREELEAEVAALLGGDDDPLAIALVIEEAQALGPSLRAAQPATGGEPCRLEKDCGGREPLAGNGRCMTCGANRAELVVLESNPGAGDGWVKDRFTQPSDTEAPESREMSAEAAAAHSVAEEAFDPTGRERAAHEAQIAVERTDQPLTARLKAALGLTDAELGSLIGVSRPTAQAYASGRLPEIVDSIRAEYMLRAVRKRAGQMRLVEAELERIIAVSD